MAGELSAAERRYPTSEVRGSDQECQVATVQEWPRGATAHLRSGVAAGKINPHPRSSDCTGAGRPRGAIPR